MQQRESFPFDFVTECGDDRLHEKWYRTMTMNMTRCVLNALCVCVRYKETQQT